LDGSALKQARRWQLRAATSDLHAALDSRVEASGYFASRERYARYIQGLELFHRLAVDRLAGTGFEAGERFVTMIGARGHMLRRDLEDFQASPLHTSIEFPAARDAADTLGMLYVIEGSNLGAALLAPRAQALGLSEQSGARALAAQAAALDEWRDFLTLLESTPLTPAEEARSAAVACTTFAAAAACFAEDARG
jgi:heme oxygenase